LSLTCAPLSHRRTGSHHEDQEAHDAKTHEGLAKIIDKRFAALAEHTRALTLDRQFVANLRDSITRFNGFARSGDDQEFGRGSVPIDEYFHKYGPRAVANPMPNITMHPIADTGPYYAILMAPGALDTKGAPQTDPQTRILDDAGQPIPGLYGAGNCVASPTGPGYWCGGATLGPALTFGRIAGRHVHAATPAEFDFSAPLGSDCQGPPLCVNLSPYTECVR
jgi:3-oxosteroid 1-dehydrogenase